MQRSIVLKDQEIKYTYRRLRRAKKLTITVKRDASVMVTAPYYFSLKFAEKALAHQADWVLKKIQEFQATSNLFFVKSSATEYKKYKEQARTLIHDKVEKINQIYNFSYSRIAIRRQTTMWGSCSSKGNLNFNYKLYFLPDHLAEYVVAHELCHLREMNHSKNFWKLVSLAVPDYRARLKELKSSY